MSKLQLKSGRGRWSVVLAILIMAATATAVFAIAYGGVTGTWHGALPNDSARCLAYDNTHGTAENFVKWGRPQGDSSCPAAMSTAKSGYGFDGEDGGGDVAPSTSFLVGTFKHYNNPIYDGTSITQVDMDLSVSICGATRTFTNYTYYHDETPNAGDANGVCAYGPAYTSGGTFYPASEGWPGGSRLPNQAGDTGPNRLGCADRVTLPYDIPTQSFTCNVGGVDYQLTLWLQNFIPTCVPGGPASRYLYTVETATTQACVYGQIAVPSAISLASLTATQQGNAIQVAWDTYSEVDNAGFNLYRDTLPGGPGVKLNAALIPSQGPNSSTGFSYSYTDSADLVSGTTYYYRLEDVSLSGSAAAHDPVSVTYVTPTAVSLASFGAGAALPAALPFVAAGLAALAGLGLALRRR